MKNTETEWQSGIRQLHTEAAGLLQIYTVSPQEGVYVMVAAAMGDPLCQGLARALAQSVSQIEQAAKRQPVLCLCCPRPITTAKGATLVLAVPDNERPSNALGSALCRSCAQQPGAEEAVIEALRGVWPNLRPITISHAAGRA